MSWDVLLFPLPDGITSMEAVPDDYEPPPIGTRAEVHAAVLRAEPGADLSDPAWGVLSAESWSIELNIGRKDPVASVMLHVRGGDDEVLPAVFRLAEALGCRALDCSDGELLAPGDGAGGNWHAFQEYRDRVVGTEPAREGPGR